MSLITINNPILPNRLRTHVWIRDLKMQWRNSSLHLINQREYQDCALAREYVSRVERPRPLDYAAYHDLALGMSAEEDRQERTATNLLARAHRASLNSPVLTLPRLTNFSCGFYPREALICMRRWLGLAAPGLALLDCVSGSRFMAAAALVKRSLIILNRFSPEASEEINEVVSEIVLCEIDESRNQQFVWRSACSFAVWGAIFLNPRHHADELDYLCSIVENSARLALFAGALRHPLILQPELTPEGLAKNDYDTHMEMTDASIHCAFAAARLALVLDLIHGQVLSKDKRKARSPLIRGEREISSLSVEQIQIAHSQALARFWTHHSVIENSRYLSEAGRELMHQVFDHMLCAYGWQAG